MFMGRNQLTMEVLCYEKIKIDGVCGPNTIKGIKDIQRELGFPVKEQDGIVGEYTWLRIYFERGIYYSTYSLPYIL